MPYMITKQDGKVCVCKQNPDKSAGESLHCYTGPDAEKQANDYMKALYANMPMKEQMMEAFADFMGMFDFSDSGSASDYLVVEDEKQPSTWHLRVKVNGKPDHTLMGAAWAALHDGYRGNKYEGPNKQAAITKLTALYKSEKMDTPGGTANASLEDVFFTDLSDFEHISTIDGLPATLKGALIDMHGNEVNVPVEDLPLYVENTQRVLESTKDSSGNIVGLPIDTQKHDHQGGAGWLVGLELDQTRHIIKFIINWTNEGIALVKNNIRRFFSASFDPKQKVILGGSMTNTPATRGADWQYMLRPIELSEHLKELDMSNTIEETLNKILLAVQGKGDPTTDAPAPAPKPKTENGDPVELSVDENDKLSELAENRAKVMLKEAKRKDHVVEFAASLTGGTKEKPFGLPVSARKVTKLLLSLPEAQAAEVEEMLSLALGAAIDFAEHGIAGEGFIQRPKLPEEYREAARIWVSEKKSMQDFFKQIATELKYDDFNLIEFEGVKE